MHLAWCVQRLIKPSEGIAWIISCFVWKIIIYGSRCTLKAIEATYFQNHYIKCVMIEMQPPGATGETGLMNFMCAESGIGCLISHSISA